MKKIATILVAFLILIGTSFFVRAESFPSNRSLLEKETNIFHPLSIIGQNINGRLQEFYSRILNSNLKNNDQFSDFIFSPLDIELKDDAFHGAETFHFAEWWYFDARFDNGYSIHLSICLLSIVNQGIIFLNFNLYKDGDLISHNKKLYDIADFSTSTDVPLVILDGKEIMSICKVEQGPIVGRIKKAIEDAILDGKIANEHNSAYNYLLQVKKELLENEKGIN